MSNGEVFPSKSVNLVAVPLAMFLAANTAHIACHMQTVQPAQWDKTMINRFGHA